MSLAHVGACYHFPLCETAPHPSPNFFLREAQQLKLCIEISSVIGTSLYTEHAQSLASVNIFLLRERLDL